MVGVNKMISNNMQGKKEYAQNRLFTIKDDLEQTVHGLDESGDAGCGSSHPMQSRGELLKMSFSGWRLHVQNIANPMTMKSDYLAKEQSTAPSDACCKQATLLWMQLNVLLVEKLEKKLSDLKYGAYELMVNEDVIQPDQAM